MKDELQKSRLKGLRAEMKAFGLRAYLIPRADEHQNEYVPPCAERLNWISGFNGTAGLAAITIDTAAMFVDGRYTLQVQDECSDEFWKYKHLTDNPLDLWLSRLLSSGDKVGFDPKLFTNTGLGRIKTVLENAKIELVAIEENLIDKLWQDQPAPPLGSVFLYPEKYSGEPSKAKRDRIAGGLKETGQEALVVSSPDNLAWLFNIRGSDLALTPIALGYAILKSDGSSTLFMDAQKLSAEVQQHLEDDGVLVASPDQFEPTLKTFKDKTVRVDHVTGSAFIVDVLRKSGAQADLGPDPCTADKACKNDTELQGMQKAHIRDGVALVKFFHWFKQQPAEAETEWTVSEQLARFREQGDLYKSPSFQTISAVGANGAIVHYGLVKEKASPLKSGELYLVDSGGQYLDGTTDVTRVLAIGAPTEEMVRRYTQVLKGHVAVSSARFVEGTTGAALDPLARQFLWADGVDYDHGTGHGVGCYLSVHEGPQSISKRGTATSLQPGMVLSNEPGYYKAGAFGIRIESLLVVKQLEPQPKNAERATLGFETLTLAPFERSLIDVGMLSADECNWINAYHTRVRETLVPLLNDFDAAFLKQETRHIHPRSL
ncbi:MAG: X-Pro aminopeptidase [Rhodospirillaceae bacterium]|nr:MAG: X-Pro aminopeptidase [Rhodospirillaceae bacterium]